MGNYIIIDDPISNDSEKTRTLYKQLRKLVEKRLGEKISTKIKILKSKTGLPIKSIVDVYQNRTIRTLQIKAPSDLIK
jgi:hypothetical protein